MMRRQPGSNYRAKKNKTTGIYAGSMGYFQFPACWKSSPAMVLDYYKEYPRILTGGLRRPFKHLEFDLIATAEYRCLNLLNGCLPLHSPVATLL